VRILMSLLFFVLAVWFVLQVIADDVVEENGGVKATLIELGQDAIDVWHEVTEYVPGDGKEPSSE